MHSEDNLVVVADAFPDLGIIRKDLEKMPYDGYGGLGTHIRENFKQILMLENL